MDGEKVNLKKEFQFFGTPQKLAEELVMNADVQEHHSVLEPSAGQGAIINAIFKLTDRKEYIYYCELMDINRGILERINKAVWLLFLFWLFVLLHYSIKSLCVFVFHTIQRFRLVLNTRYTVPHLPFRSARRREHKP